MNNEEVTPTFLALSAGPAQIKDDDIAALEWFTILLYVRTSSINIVDQIAKNYSRRREEQWMLFLQQKQLLCTTLKELFIKGDTSGARCYKLVLTCQLLKTGDPTTERYCGPHYLSQVLHPENCFTVGARKLAQDDVNVRKLH